MSAFPKCGLLAAALLTFAWTHEVQADRQTACTITVNSPDEKEMFRRSLPADQFDFIELVERGRPDWLESACRAGVHCDVLLISGHFDDGTQFYSDRPDAREYLPVDELERASCSDSCSGLFAHLKEVYLFGCNTLNPEPLRSASGEIARSLVRAGHSPADVEQLMRKLGERYGESNRDRMRQIFKDVPVIYGFWSKAPLGPSAATVLERYFQTAPGGEIGSGRPSARLLGLFAPSSMTVAAGVRDTDEHAAYRADVCRFSNDTLSPSASVAGLHAALRRDMTEVRMLLGRIEKYAASVLDVEPRDPAVTAGLGVIVADEVARKRYLEFTRDADDPAIRVRLIRLATRVGWLSPTDERAELLRMVGDQLRRGSITAADVDLVCDLNRDGTLGQELERLPLRAAGPGDVSRAAVLACLGSAEAHTRVLQALSSASEEDVQIAQAYLHHRPIADVNQLRAVAAAIAKMNGSAAQVRALDTLARQQVSDRLSLDELTRLFPHAKSLEVQRAIAGILIRADYASADKPQLARALRQARVKSPDGPDVIDILIRRLQAP